MLNLRAGSGATRLGPPAHPGAGRLGESRKNLVFAPSDEPPPVTA